MPIAPLLGLAALAQPVEVDWDAATAEATTVLQDYLRTDTTNPPGNETRGAEYLAGLMEAEGIPWEIFESAPGRGNLVARLEGSSDEGGLCLLSHIDVVEAEPDKWPQGKGPLSGTLDQDGILWGRGALDMKGMGAIEAMTLILLKRHQVPLRRDVVLLAVADEEMGNGGMEYMVEHHWEDLGCSHFVNEGGVGLKSMFFDDQDILTISTGEKGVVWLRMVATGEPGHGSTPRSGQAPEALLRAVERIQSREAKPNWRPELMNLLHAVGTDHGGLSGFVLRHPALVKLALKKKLMGNPLTRATLTDTVNITGFGGAMAHNVVASEAWVNLDCRLQPGTDPDAFQAELEALVDDPSIRFERVHTLNAAVSPVDDPLYQALARRGEEVFPNAVAGPVLSVGFTDTIFARDKGARGYGLEPFMLTQEDLETMHGHGERISVNNLGKGLQVLFMATVDFAAEPQGG